MSALTIRDGIIHVLGTVVGIGVIHGYRRFDRSVAAWKQLMTSGGLVNGWEVYRVSTETKRYTLPTQEREHKFKIAAVYTHNDAGASEETFQNLLDAVFNAFKSNHTLNSTALNSEPLQLDSVTADELLNTSGGSAGLYHFAEMTLVATERVFYQ